MNSTMTRNTQKTFEELSIPSARALPTTPFPRKHVHSAFNDRQDALQAAEALRQADFDARDIYLLTSADYTEALGRGQTFFSSLTSTDLDVYLDAARRGCTILAVRLANYGQVEQVRFARPSRRSPRAICRYLDGGAPAALGWSLPARTWQRSCNRAAAVREYYHSLSEDEFTPIPGCYGDEDIYSSFVQG